MTTTGFTVIALTEREAERYVTDRTWRAEVVRQAEAEARRTGRPVTIYDHRGNVIKVVS